MVKVKIGILNLMHDKIDTQKRFYKVLPNAELTCLYPHSHYQNRPVPAEGAATSEPLYISRINEFDSFIITGAPIDHLAFKDVYSKN